MSEKRKVVVLGAGTWGLALARLLWENGHEVRAWDHFAAVIDKLKVTRGHPRLEGLRIPDDVLLTADLSEAMSGAEAAVVTAPSQAVRDLCASIRAAGLESGIGLWIMCSKGIEQGTLLPMHEVIADALGPEVGARVCVLTGPSHAEEVCRDLPISVVAAAPDIALAGRVQQLFNRPSFRIYTHDDVLGAELGASVKNVIAIAAGVADGLGFGDSTRATLITRSIVEIIRLGVAMGARQETFMGLAGIGDLIATAGSPHSRNHQFGELLARGRTCEEALAEVGMVVEGQKTAQSVHDLAQKHGVEMPISEAVFQVLYKGVPAKQALAALLAREPRAEVISS